MLTHYYKDIPIYLILIISVYHIFDFQFPYSFALSLTTTIPVQNDPRSSAFDDENNKIYVTNHGSASVSVIDGTSDTVIKNITVGNDPFHLIYASTPSTSSSSTLPLEFSFFPIYPKPTLQNPACQLRPIYSSWHSARPRSPQ